MVEYLETHNNLSVSEVFYTASSTFLFSLILPQADTFRAKLSASNNINELNNKHLVTNIKYTTTHAKN